MVADAEKLNVPYMEPGPVFAFAALPSHITDVQATSVIVSFVKPITEESKGHGGPLTDMVSVTVAVPVRVKEGVRVKVAVTVRVGVMVGVTVWVQAGEFVHVGVIVAEIVGL
jgi:hypothetical protein